MDLKQQWNDLWAQGRGVWLVLCLLLILLVWTVVAYIGGISLALAPAPVQTASGLSLSTPMDLANQSLFGRYAQRQVNLPPLSAGLTLQGVVSDPGAPTSSHALAIVSGSGGQVKTYHVGDALPGGATIIQILPNMLVVNYGGQEQALRLPVPKLGQ